MITGRMLLKHHIFLPAAIKSKTEVDDQESRGSSGCTVIQQIAPITASAAATAKELIQPKRCAIHGVREAVTAPPICPPMFTMLEKTPELRPAISTDTDQKELCEK